MLRYYISLAIAGLLCVSVAEKTAAEQAVATPNFVIFYVDDLGWSYIYWEYLWSSRYAVWNLTTKLRKASHSIKNFAFYENAWLNNVWYFKSGC